MNSNNINEKLEIVSEKAKELYSLISVTAKMLPHRQYIDMFVYYSPYVFNYFSAHDVCKYFAKKINSINELKNADVIVDYYYTRTAAFDFMIYIKV